MVADTGRKDRRKGRVEAGLEHELVERHEIRAAERAALRAMAHAVDMAEANRDSDAVARANSVYLDMRSAAGLSANGNQPVDVGDTLLAELLRPGPGASDVPNT